VEDGRVRGKVCLVTGGGGAIGRAIVQLLAAEGGRVAFCDLDEALGRETVALVTAAGGTAVFTRVDVTSEPAVRAWVEATVGLWGGVHVLVNNAAAFVFGTIDETTPEMWTRVLTVNVVAYAYCARAVVPHMRRQGGGSILNVASVSSFIGQPQFVPYNTSKGAVLQLTRTLATDLGKDNIRVNSICPGTIDTPATRAHAIKLQVPFEQFAATVQQGLCLRRLGHVNDVAYAILFLASDESTFSTGTCLIMDGGFLTWKL
jgi:NAD(P)-dependent dehydrogenase (short-subunit alcohol dehydrogenase family)